MQVRTKLLMLATDYVSSYALKREQHTSFSRGIFMGNTDPGLRAGNTPPAIDLKFGKASDAFHATERAVMARALTAARQIFHDSAEQSVREWGVGAEGEYKVTVTDRTYDKETRLADVPARVTYRDAEREAHPRAGLGKDDSRQLQVLSSVLSVTFNPEASEPEVFTFDFEAKDPVEELVRTGQNITVDGTPLDVFQGTSFAIGIIRGASRSVFGWLS
jgi:hypothetical protein